MSKKLGKTGEDLAVAFLQRKGYTIVERNFRILQGELDIIAQDGEYLVFVEVKTARSLAFGAPETWVTRRKQMQIGQIAAAYLQQKEYGEIDCRFDVIAITFHNERPTIKHIENAFWL